MNFLEGVQALVKLAGVSSTPSPSSVTTNAGRLSSMVDYFQRAHEEVQNLHFDWLFLWAEGSQNTIADQPDYGDTDVGIWNTDRIYLDGQKLPVYQWADYAKAEATPPRPESAILRPDNRLLLIPTPDKAYELTYEYYKAPKVLVENTDEPLIPKQFRMVIVGRALIMYANYESAEEVKMQGTEIYQQYLEQLERHQLPRRQQTHGRSDSIDMVVTTE